MKILLVLPLVFLLSGCWKTIPSLPDPPPSIVETCVPLQKAEDPQLEAFLKTVVQNYNLYHLCSNKHQDLVTWYRAVQKNYKEAQK
jgi:hypothetical protein